MASKSIDFMKCYSSLAKNNEFKSLKTRRDRIVFILKHVQTLRQFRNHVYGMIKHHHKQHLKSAEKSLEHRKRGVDYHNSEQYVAASFEFTKAILTAPIEEEEVGSISHLCLAFAHKSMSEFQLGNYLAALSLANHSLELCQTIEMLLHRIHCLRLMRRYRECLQYLDQLLQSNSTNDEINTHLIEIRRYIIERIDSPDYPEAIPETIYSPETMSKGYETDVWVHPGCEFTKTERKGRHVVAKQFIPKGTILLLEKSFNVELAEELKTRMCSNCYERIEGSFWPCMGCDEVVFCDKKCFSQAYEEYHQYDCGISSIFTGTWGISFMHSFHVLSRAGIQKVLECEERNNFFDFDHYLESQMNQIGNPTDNYEAQFEAFYSLTYHDSKSLDLYPIIFNTFGAIKLAILLDYTQQLNFDIEEDFEKYVTLADICVKNYSRVQTNVFGWWRDVVPKTTQRRLIGQPRPSRERLGSSICNVASLINHSCDPNVYWSWDGPKLTFKATRNINPGDEICITYGPTARTMDFMDRQMKLKTNYYFDCNCGACLRDCKTLLCLRCGFCSGPVVNVDLVNWIHRDDRCLKCGQEFKNMKQIGAKVNGLKQRFDQMMCQLAYDHNIEVSLIIAQSILNQLFELVYSESKPLRECFHQLLRAMVKNNRLAEAVQCIERFGSIIDLKYDSIGDPETISADILDELILLTNCYYMHLNCNGVLNAKQWNNCFQLYSKLIELLRKGKKASKYIPATDPIEMEGLVQNFRFMLKEKKVELMHLNDCYQSGSAVNQI